jgi:hypothetical protein
VTCAARQEPRPPEIASALEAWPILTPCILETLRSPRDADGRQEPVCETNPKFRRKSLCGFELMSIANLGHRSILSGLAGLHWLLNRQGDSPQAVAAWRILALSAAITACTGGQVASGTRRGPQRWGFRLRNEPNPSEEKALSICTYVNREPGSREEKSGQRAVGSGQFGSRKNSVRGAPRSSPDRRHLCRPADSR